MVETSNYGGTCMNEMRKANEMFYYLVRHTQLSHLLLLHFTTSSNL